MEKFEFYNIQELELCVDQIIEKRNYNIWSKIKGGEDMMQLYN